MKKVIFFLSVITLTLAVLKLTHCIDWSWWLVSTPLLAPLAIFMFLVVWLTIKTLIDINKGMTEKE